ncbi:hypothetical protein ACGFNV_39595 [Streptomyces sp. NPDC048751]|uniref:GHMP family kinase ATP-binding protein n=1 Tax=Streptomyces sp. NPDC048751 TaxID=3365591 RepID=UPI003718F4EE
MTHPSDSGSAVVCEAPMRLTVAGGGTDLPEVYGFGPTWVLGVTVDLAVRVAVADSPRFATAGAGLSTRDAAFALDMDSDDPHPYLRAAIALLQIRKPRFHVSVRSHVLPGSGLGGSGAFCAALLGALARFQCQAVTVADIAEAAFRLERELLGRPVGKQDAWISAVGGAVRLSLSSRGHVRTRAHPALLTAMERLLDRDLLVFALPDQRDAARVLSAAAPGTEQARAAALRAAEMTEQAFLSCDTAVIGDVLRRHWAEKVRRNPAADHELCRRVAATAGRTGIHGFKLLGAGGGGHMLVALDSSRRAEVMACLSGLGLAHVPVKVTRRGLTAAPVRPATSGASQAFPGGWRGSCA